MENIIYNELKIRGYNVNVGIVEVQGKSDKKDVRRELEIDFVANLGSKRFYIQSAYSILDQKKAAQEIRPFLNTKDSFINSSNSIAMHFPFRRSLIFQLLQVYVLVEFVFLYSHFPRP